MVDALRLQDATSHVPGDTGMLFNSWQFLLFYPAVAILFFQVPYQRRWVWLLLASYAFYMCAVPAYALLLATSTGIDYCCGRAMAGTTDRKRRTALLIVSLSANLGLLAGFKYFNFFSESLEQLARLAGLGWNLPRSDLLLPVGISFYTFQTLSYTIDVYRGQAQPERHLGRFALYVSFFPQLVAGPIERSTRLLPQLGLANDFDYARVTGGLKLMAWGMFKKVVIADNLARVVNRVYGAPHEYEGIHFTIVTVFFAYQIYCDFSGYSDIAIGAAQVFGVELMDNFRQPYLADSIRDFWARWHISLSTWFRDYLYIPLGGNRVTVPRWTLNILVVFVVSGLWHGAKWTFVAWGGLHALYFLLSAMTARTRNRFSSWLRLDRSGGAVLWLRRAAVFALVCFAWVFFRADSMADAAFIVSHLATGWERALDLQSLRDVFREIDMPKLDLAIIVGSILVMETVDAARSTAGPRNLLQNCRGPVRWGFYVLLMLAILNFGASEQEEFIYFQF